MNMECLIQTNGIAPMEILANFLKTFGAVMKYGHTTLYEGDCYYIPYYMMTYQVEETGESYAFLNSQLSEDISMFPMGGSVSLKLEQKEVDACFLLNGEKEESEARQQIRKKLQMNRKLRKLYSRYHLMEQSWKKVYIQEQSFYAKGKSEYLFLVDGFLGKVDFKHLGAVERRFAENYIKNK